MVCYLTLNRFILAQTRSGEPALSFYNSHKDTCKTVYNTLGENEDFFTTYEDWLHAIDGFKANISFDLKEAFTCINCGVSPRYFVADGKNVGPTKRKLLPLNLTELSAPKDDVPLREGFKK